MDLVPEDVTHTLTEVDDTISKLESQLEPLFEVSLQELKEKLQPVDQAKLHMTLAYAINSLFYMFLKTQGVSTQNHPVVAEMGRIKEYFEKLKDLTNRAKAARIDQQAAARFIKHGVGKQNTNSSDTTEKEIDSTAEPTPEANPTTNENPTPTTAVTQKVKKPTASKAQPTTKQSTPKTIKPKATAPVKPKAIKPPKTDTKKSAPEKRKTPPSASTSTSTTTTTASPKLAPSSKKSRVAKKP
ncbi:nuclear nucleic acid-binding protein C1D [Pelomyxa schiedti]|nr:nuclear nucleic acid-binding protein C1D [Pelomyxa schiedti]